MAKPEQLCGSQREGRVKGTGDKVLKLSELEQWGVQVFADEPEPLAEMFLLPCAAAWHFNGSIADHNHCSGSPSYIGNILENESMETHSV